MTKGELIAAIIIGIGLIAVISTPGWAIDSPDEVTIDDTKINRHLMETDDMLIYFTPNVNYDTTPNETITEAFAFCLLDTDGVTIIATRDGYAYDNNGYGLSLCSFYFTAADNITWAQSYTIRIIGKVSVFGDDPPIYDFPINVSEYSEYDTQVENRAEATVNMLDMANELSSSMDIELTEEIDVKTVLTSDGADLFRNAIPGIQAMVPALFDVVIYDPDYTGRDWTKAQSENYSGTYVDTPEGSASSGFWSSMFNFNFSFGMAAPMIIACAILLIASTRMTNQVFSGMLNSSACIIISAPAGWLPMAIVSIGALLLSFYSSLRLFLKG